MTKGKPEITEVADVVHEVRQLGLFAKGTAEYENQHKKTVRVLNKYNTEHPHSQAACTTSLHVSLLNTFLASACPEIGG